MTKGRIEAFTSLNKMDKMEEKTIGGKVKVVN
jgi:hypothetical protein